MTKTVNVAGKRTHGMSTHPLYGVWAAMRKRCSRQCPSHLRHRYYERGIRMCSAWEDPKAFITWAEQAGWEPGLECDREDNDGNYCPENCRFVDRITNASNVGVRTDSTSGFRGISYITAAKRWRAYITANKKLHHLGYHDTLIEAVSARNMFITVNKLPHPIQEVPNRNN
ncbi:MAG: hypothetical protein KAS32_24320 [Candidatus Peribacteraceae bacterium]|nr:hypothetical protein [Candidatus Peribacteraceae bacterium]